AGPLARRLGPRPGMPPGPGPRPVPGAGAGAVAGGSVAPRADGVHARAATAGADAVHAVAPAARHLAGLVADEAALDVAVVETGGEIAGRRQRREGSALLRLPHAQAARGARAAVALLLGQRRVDVLDLLDLVLAGLLVGVLLAHLALFEGHLGSGAAGGLVVFVVLVLGRLGLLLRLDRDARGAKLAVEIVVRVAAGVGGKQGHEADERAGDGERGEREDEERGVEPEVTGGRARRRHRRDEEGVVPGLDADARLVRDRPGARQLLQRRHLVVERHLAPHPVGPGEDEVAALGADELELLVGDDVGRELDVRAA